MEGAQIGAIERGHRFASAEDRVAVRVAAPQLSVVELEDEIVGGVVHGTDLLENDFALEGEVRRAQDGPEDQVGEDVGRLWQMLVENLRLICGVLTRRVRIERASKRLEREGELLGAARGSALENHVLEHVRDAHLLDALVK